MFVTTRNDNLGNRRGGREPQPATGFVALRSSFARAHQSLERARPDTSMWCSGRIGGSKIRPNLITGGSLSDGPLSPSKETVEETRS
jgi:hypothetical protein